MSIVSKWTIGAMASKKASASAPVSSAIASASDGRGQRAGGDDRLVPFGGRQAGDLLALDGDQRMRFEPGGHGGGKAVAVDGQRAAGRHLVGVARRHDQRAGKPHLGMQQPDRIVLGVVGAEGVGADELGQAIGLVRVGAAHAGASRAG